MLELLEEAELLKGKTLKILSNKKFVPTFILSGIIEDGLGDPVEDVNVEISGSNFLTTIFTDVSGNYSLSGLLAGTYIITPTKTGLEFIPDHLDVVISLDSTGNNFVSPVTYTITLVGTGANYHNSESTWYNTGNIVVNDSSYANCCVSDHWTSDTLKFIVNASQVPADSTIKGILISTIRKFTDAGQPCTDTVVQLMNSNTFIGNNKKNDTAWATVDWQTVTYGGLTDLWGYALTPMLLNSGNFAFGIRVDKSGGSVCDEAYVQYINMSISVKVPAEES
jgi:hypothetical protein